MFAAYLPEDRHGKLTRERMEATKLGEELLALEHHEDRMVFVATHPKYWTWGLCEWLIEQSWGHRYDDANKTLRFAELAAALADTLCKERSSQYGIEHLQDLAARTEAHCANALRILSEYDDAEELFKETEELLAVGTGDRIVEAQVLYLKAHLETDKGRWGAATAIYDRLITIFRDRGDRVAEAAMVVHQGKVAGLSDDLELAVTLLEKSLETLNLDTDRAMFLMAKQILALFFYQQGYIDNARRIISKIYPLFEEDGDRLNLARVGWLEGRIALAMGHDTVGEAALVKARDTFLAQDIGFDAAEVALDLAALYLRTGRTEAMRQLAVQLVPIFHTRDMHRYAAAALAFFQKAVEKDAVSTGLIEQIVEYLKKARHNHELLFQPVRDTEPQ